MIRPLTIATFLLAGASGLYLYQSKHEVQLLDRTIERTVRETSALRAQSRLLATEWEMLNNTDRLRQFSDTYLSLKTITPSQFTSLADLDNRLPAPLARDEDEQKSVPVATDAETGEAPEPTSAAIADETMPVPPIPGTPAAVAVTSLARPAESRTPERVPVPRPAVAESQPRSVAESHPPEQRQAEQRAGRVAEARAEVRTPAPSPPKPIVLAAPRPASVITPVNARPAPAPVPSRPAMMATAAPYSGSLLGMARGSVPPAPRPLPVSASYDSN